MEFNQILTDGGAGDLICELVAVDYNIKHSPEVHFSVWVPDYLVDFAKHVLPPMTRVKAFSEATFDFGIHGLSTAWKCNHTPMRTHPVDYGFHMLSDRHVYNLNHKNYLQIKPEQIDHGFILPEKYVCIVTTAAEPVKEMPIETINALSDYVISKGYLPVFLGKEEAKAGFKDMAIRAKKLAVDYSKGMDLTNKTDLLRAAKVIHGAKAIIGMDGGLIHLAGCTDTFIVAGYTLVDPIHVAPIRCGSQSYKFRPVEPDPEIPHRYYQTHHSGFKRGDFRRFSGWTKVVASMTPDKFIKHLEPIL